MDSFCSFIVLIIIDLIIIWESILWERPPLSQCAPSHSKCSWGSSNCSASTTESWEDLRQGLLHWVSGSLERSPHLDMSVGGWTSSTVHQSIKELMNYPRDKSRSQPHPTSSSAISRLDGGHKKERRKLQCMSSLASGKVSGELTNQELGILGFLLTY